MASLGPASCKNRSYNNNNLINDNDKDNDDDADDNVSGHDDDNSKYNTRRWRMGQKAAAEQ